MSKFYTDFFKRGKYVYIREVDNGVRKQYKSRIRPSLFVRAKGEESEYTDIHGNFLTEKKFETPKMADAFADQYADSDFPIYGFPHYEYTAINEIYPGRDGIEFNSSKIRVGYLDIETESENGFPDLIEANERVNCLTLIFKGKSYVLGLQKLEYDIGCSYYKYCETEEDLLRNFIKIWKRLNFDVITGWNTEGFDIPYMIRRIDRVLGEGKSKELSPWGIIRSKTVQKFNNFEERFIIEGISNLDYLLLYKKFTYNQLESYSLDHVSHVELKNRKLDYSEYESMKDLYTNNFTKWVEYNLKDTYLVTALEDKLRFMELAFTMCYSMKIQFKDVFTSVRLWDVVIANYLYNTRKAIVPYHIKKSNGVKYEGAYVKHPLVGKYDWVASFDLTSLYPSLIITHNISPETICDKKVDLNVNDVIGNDDKMEEIGRTLQKDNLSVCSNGTMYTRDKVGVLPELMKHYFNMRKEAKKKKFECETDLEQVKAEMERRGL